MIRRAALLLWVSLAAPVSGAADMESRLAAADPDRGEQVFRRCAACHTVERDGGTRAGPNLWGIVGAPVARQERFRYSATMTALDGNWTPERLDAYLTRPRSVVRGTSTEFRGLAHPRDRADLIAYLNRMSNSPIDVGGGAAVARRATGPEEDGIGLLATGTGAAETHGACTACHSERIVIQQGLPRRQWDELLDWMVDEHGMSPLRGRIRDTVLDYLARQYGPDRPNYPAR